MMKYIPVPSVTYERKDSTRNVLQPNCRDQHSILVAARETSQ